MKLGFQFSRFGFNDRNWKETYWRNPVYGRYNLYAVNPRTEFPYMDTRTQYLNLNYTQGIRGLIMIDGILSRNINPQWNFTGCAESRLR